MPGAAAFSLTSLSMTASLSSVPVQSAARRLPAAVLTIMVCMNGTQLMRLETMKVFGQASTVEPL